jgi:hypothetical protein
VTLFPSVLCSPPPVYRNCRTPPIDSREVPFPNCAFRQSPHENNKDIACENKNQTSLSFPYLSFYQVLDSFLGISLLLRQFSLLPVDSIFKTLSPGEVLTGIRVLADYPSYIYVGLTNTNIGLARVCSACRKWYVLVLVNDYSRYAWVFFLADKGEMFGFVRDLILR